MWVFPLDVVFPSVTCHKSIGRATSAMRTASRATPSSCWSTMAAASEVCFVVISQDTRDLVVCAVVTESTCQELIDWLGAWVRKQGFLLWVQLWDCASVHRKASLMEWVRAPHPECRVLFLPGGFTAELQPADISIQQPLKHIIRQQAMQSFAESVCRDEAVTDLRLSTMERLMPHWVLHACAEVENTSVTTKAWRHLSWTFEEALRLAARATREHLNAHYSMRRRWNKKSHQKKRTSFSMMTTTMANPESTDTAVAEAVVPSSTVASQVERAEHFLYLRCAYGKHPPKP